MTSRALPSSSQPSVSSRLWARAGLEGWPVLCWFRNTSAMPTPHAEARLPLQELGRLFSPSPLWIPQNQHRPDRVHVTVSRDMLINARTPGRKPLIRVTLLPAGISQLHAPRLRSSCAARGPSPWAQPGLGRSSRPGKLNSNSGCFLLKDSPLSQ